MISGCVDAGYLLELSSSHIRALRQGSGHKLEPSPRGRACGLWLDRQMSRNWPRLCSSAEASNSLSAAFQRRLLTASSIYGLPVTRLGTELMLERLTPFQNSNRIPITLVDALMPDLPRSLNWTKESAAVTESDWWTRWSWPLGYTMQPVRLASRHSEASTFLADHYESHARYFKRRRLTALGLPGSLPAPPPKSRPTLGRRVRRLVRRARRALGRRLLGASRPLSG